jgi:hypothetical protein
MDTGICRTCSSLKFLRRINSCSAINSRLNAIVNCPSVNENLRLETYGIDDMGDVPRFAFVTIATPSELIYSPIKKIRYRFSFSMIQDLFPSSIRI